MKDQFDPLALIRGYPSFSEEKRYDIETEVGVHLARARAVQRIKFKRAALIVGIGALFLLGCWLGWHGYTLFGIVPAVVAVILTLWCYSGWEADSLLVDTFLSDIVDPQRDSERRAELDRVLEFQARRPIPGPAQTVRVEYVEKQHGHAQPMISLPDLPGPPARLQWFSKNVLNGDPFSQRTAMAAGYTREEWQAMRDIFIDRHWCVLTVPRSPKHGVTLRRSGLAVLERMMAMAIPYEMVPLIENRESIVGG